MVRRIILVLLGALMTAPWAGAQTVTLKIATLVPDGSLWMKKLTAAADEIATQTAGRVSIRFYPGGAMGTDEAVLRKMRIGQLQGGVVLAGSLSSIDPDMEIYDLPLLFRSYDEVDFVRARMDARLISGLEEKGYVSFGFTGTGFAYLMSTRATQTLDDLKGRKAWMPQDDPVSLAIVEAAALSPVPLPVSDVLTGLQTGLIDTVAAPPVGAVALQWFTKATYLTDLPLTYLYGTVVVDARAFDKIGVEDQKIVREDFGRATREMDQASRKDDAEAREALAKQGVTFVVPADETRARWDEIAAAATRSLVAERGYDAAILAEVRQLIEEHRAGESSPTGGE